MNNVIPIRSTPDATEARAEMKEALPYLDHAQRLWVQCGRHDIALRIAAHKYAIEALIELSRREASR